MVNSILYNEKPLTVNPKLAEAIGLNKSIIIQQIHYWIENINKKKGKDSINYQDDFYWTFNTYKEWQKQFPFWSISTIRRTIKKLENDNIIISDDFNKNGFDKTKWYRINHERLNVILTNRVSQSEQTTCSEWTEEDVNMNRPIPESTSESTSESTNNKKTSDESDNDSSDTEYKYNKDSKPYKAAKKLKKLIKQNNERQPVPDDNPKDMKKWSTAMDRLNRLGPPGGDKGYSWDEIYQLIEWCQQDEFWSDNILSAPKFREKIVKLENRMDKSDNKETDIFDEFAL